MINKSLYSIFICVLALQLNATSRSDSTLNPGLLGPQTEKVNVQNYAKVYYISNHNGSDKKGAGSKKEPWKTISHALETIDNPSQTNTYALLVSRGVYDNKTLVMKEYVDIYGGFDAKFWQRDIHTNTTVLDGKNVRRVVEGASNARIDGFTIQNGLSQTHGAGVLCEDTSPLISNNFIVHNMVLEPQDFNNSRIHQNGNHGGGIAALYNGVPMIINNLFYENKTSIGTGAAIAFYGWVRHKGSPPMVVKENRFTGGLRGTVKNNVIVNNTSGVNDIYRTRSSSGAGISCALEARPLIQNNMIAGNTAKGNSDAGGIYCEFYSDPHINGNWILGNRSDDDGGGFYTMKLGQPLLTNNIFAGNLTAGGGVGAIRLSKEGRARIVDNVIVRNPGGGVMCVDAYMELEDNIIMDNSLSSGLKYVMRYSYFQPSYARNNYFNGNEQGAISIVENSGPDLLLENNKLNVSLVQSQPEQGKVMSLDFDPLKYTTKVVVENAVDTQSIVGRVIRVGDRWTVIKKAFDSGYMVWGNVSTSQLKSLMYEILPIYKK